MTTIGTLRLAHGETDVTIAPHRGAIVTSFRVRDRELLYLDQATFDDRSKNVRGGIPLLFPSPGKLENDRWSYAGRSGEMKQHGFARNLAWRVDEQSRDGSSATLSIEATPATRQSYPWAFNAQVTYEVQSGALGIRFVIMNEDSSPMPFALGLHPYFLVTNKARASVATRAKRAFDNVAKREIAFQGFDLVAGEVDIHLLDHGGARATLETEQDSIAIECSPEFSRWIVWTLPTRDFVCLEPWSAPADALNTGADLIVLAPGERRSLSVRIAV